MPPCSRELTTTSRPRRCRRSRRPSRCSRITGPTGLSLKGHPIGFYREQLDRLQITLANRLIELPHGRRVSVAGIVIVRQRPSTAKGITFVTLEDETGTANLVIRQDTWERYYTIARRSPAWIARGVLERKDAVMHVLVQRMEDLSVTIGKVQHEVARFSVAKRNLPFRPSPSASERIEITARWQSGSDGKAGDHYDAIRTHSGRSFFALFTSGLTGSAANSSDG